jgi:hypothetical protein
LAFLLTKNKKRVKFSDLNFTPFFYLFEKGKCDLLLLHHQLAQVVLYISDHISTRWQFR